MDQQSLTAAFYLGALALVGLAWGLDRTNLPDVNRFAKFGYAQAQTASTNERWWEDSPTVAEYPVRVGPWMKFQESTQADWQAYSVARIGDDIALRHLPVFRILAHDGHRYFVQAESEAKAWEIFLAIRKTGSGEYLHRARDRIIQNPFDIFERVWRAALATSAAWMGPRAAGGDVACGKRSPATSAMNSDRMSQGGVA